MLPDLKHSVQISQALKKKTLFQYRILLMKNVWLFGYGSLIWNPDIPYVDRKPAKLAGFVRKFWQGSHDHRGTPENPGRVVTLVPCKKGHCDGIAYLVSLSTVKSVFEKLDHREKNGYRQTVISLNFTNELGGEAITYLSLIHI